MRGRDPSPEGRRPVRLRPEHWHHLGRMLIQGRRPALAVYESIGDGFPLAPAPGWLNLGLWEGPGEEEEAARAPRRLVEAVAAPLPRGGVILDVANGLGLQDEVIAALVTPRHLIVLNLSETQLRVGRPALSRAGASPVVGDAVRLPFADRSVDGAISVEAPFHFASRPAFFTEARRVLRSGGILTTSDVTAERRPRTPVEWLSGLTLLRFWGLGRHALASGEQIAAQATAAGLVDVEVEFVGDQVFDPVLALVGTRLETAPLPPLVRLTGRLLLRQWGLLWRRGLMDYMLLRARVPHS